MLWKILFGVVLAITHQFCYCDVHTYGKEEFNGKTLFRKELFNQAQDEGVARTKNYTLIFKYMNSEAAGNVTYAVFNVQNAKSYGTIVVNAEQEKNVTTLQAMLNIVNATNVIVTAELFGPSVSLTTMTNNFQRGFQQSITSKTPKTMTVIYGHNSTQTRNKKIILGHRQPGDRVLTEDRKVVKYKYRFAEAEFKYPEQESSSSTKPAITAVEFSFDTSSAIAFMNSTFITEHSVDAIVYDLNYPEFRANMIVYGYDSSSKPSTYKPIVLSRRNQF